MNIVKRIWHNPRLRAVSFIGLFATAGVAALVLTNANPFVVSNEAENGSLDGVNLVDDSAASGGRAIRFGSTASPYPNPYTTYDIPSHAAYDESGSSVKYVATNGNDANDGSQARPYATISKGVQEVAAGGKVIVRGGRYHEAIDGSSAAGVQAVSKKVSIQAYGTEKPWVDGTETLAGSWSSEVISGRTVWKINGYDRSNLCTNRADTDCMPYRVMSNRQFRRTPTSAEETGTLRYYLDGRNTLHDSPFTDTAVDTDVDTDFNPDTGNPTAALFDMVFIDGVALKQVTSKAALRPVQTTGGIQVGTFYVEGTGTNSTLYVGDNPTGRTVSVSQHPTAITVAATAAAKDTTIQGLGFFGFASYGSHGNGAVVLKAEGATIKDSVIVWSASNGLVTQANAVRVSNTHVAYSGHVGGRFIESDNIVVNGGIYAHNNFETFTLSGGYVTAAGIKIGNTYNPTIKNLLIEDNNSNGLWCDVQCEDVKFVSNTIRRNYGSGIFFEVSYGAIIANNKTSDNGSDKKSITANIKVSSSSGAKVYNNEMSGGNNGLLVFFDSRKDIDDKPPSNVWGKVMQNIVIKNNIMRNPELVLASLVANCAESGTEVPTQSFGVRYNYNAYVRTSGTAPLMKWANKSACRSIPQPASITVTSIPTTVSSVQHEANGIFKTDNSAITQTGEPITDSAVATALGISVGRSVPIGFISGL